MDWLISLFQSGSFAVIAGKAVIFITLLSAILTAVASMLQALGDKVPGWLGSVVSGLGSIVHFINGNFGAAVKKD